MLRITNDNVPNANYLVVRLCSECMKQEPEACVAAPLPMPFPNLYTAKGFLQGHIESIINGEEDNTTWNENTKTSTFIDEDGDTHIYSYGIIKAGFEVMYNFGDDEAISSQFDDIVKNMFPDDTSK